MSFLRRRGNALNRMFFMKFQQQVSKASGYTPALSYEDFIKIIAENQKAQEALKETTEVNE